MVCFEDILSFRRLNIRHHICLSNNICFYKIIFLKENISNQRPENLEVSLPILIILCDSVSL